MKIRICTFALIAFCLLLTACPYTSEIAIDEPSVPVPEEILGKWQKSGEEKDFYLISKLDRNIMSIEENSFSSDSGECTKKMYRAFISKVGKLSFLNVQKESEQSYYLYKVEIKGNELHTSPLTDNIKEKFSEPAKLKKFIKKHMNLSFFYADTDIYIKQ